MKIKSRFINNYICCVENLFNWNLAIADFNKHSEILVWLKMKQGEKPNPLIAELEAINRTEEIRYLHKQEGIEKSDKYYKYLKFALQGNIEQGLEVEERHYETIFLN